MNWITPPVLFFAAALILALSIPAYRNRKLIFKELKNWKFKGIQLPGGISVERQAVVAAPLDEKVRARHELHTSSSPITLEQAQAWTKIILGNAHGLFWDEIAKNTKNTESLAHLTADPIFLTGLIAIFEQLHSRLPQNIGALLDLLFDTLWQKDQIERSKWISAKEAKLAFAYLARYGYFSNNQLIENYTWSQYNSQYAYNELLDVLGRKNRTPSPEWFYNLSLEYISWRARVWQKTTARLEKAPRILRFLFGVPFSIVWSGLDFLASLPRRLTNFFGFRKRRALTLLALAEKFHIVQRNGEGLAFHPRAWWVYFSALNEVGRDIEDVLYHSGKHWGTNNWRRLRPEHDEVIVALCGLLPDAAVFIEKLIPLDPYLAAHCILGGADNVPDEFRIRTHDLLMDSVLNVTEGAEIHSLSAAHFLKELRNDPSVVEDILNAVDKNHIEFAGPRLAKLLAGYEKYAFNVLVKRLEVAGRSKQLILLALGFLRDERAVLILRSMLAGQDGIIRMTALMVLTTCFNDAQATAEWERTLLFRENYEDGKSLWLVVDDILEADVIPLLLQVLRRGLEMPEDTRINRGHWGDADQHFTAMLERRYRKEKKARAEEILLAAAKEQRNPTLLQSVILNALGAIQSEKAVEVLINSLSHPDPEVQIAAMRALSQINDTSAVHALIGQVYSKNPFVAEAAIRALGEIKSPEAIRVLKKQLDRTDAALHPEIPTFFGYPLDLLAMQALVEIKTDEALDAAAKWCRDHLADDRKFNYGHRGETVTEVCAEHLGRILQTDKARLYWQEWQEKQTIQSPD